MTKTQLILLQSGSDDLRQKLATEGSIALFDTPTVVLALPPKIVSDAGRVHLRNGVVDDINRNSISILCMYDDGNFSQQMVRHQLEIAAIAIQLVQPTYYFLDLWLQLDGNNLTEMVSRPVQDIDRFLPDPYLQYQQHNCLEYPDVQRAMGLIPGLSKALDPAHGSWDHPLLPIHRALMFFCQGYSITPNDPSQFLWAAGLDCLYASKLDKKAQSSFEIARRMHKLLGPKLKLYEADTVSIPMNQTTRTHSELQQVSGDIFKLRNAFAHGKPIPKISWLSSKEQPVESGYAYQLLEQTEIALRLTLLRVLEDTTIFDTFADPVKLDSYFPVP
jgi:hypothetical protein